jgi:hypothetical protein
LGWITSTAWYDKDLLSISISTWNWTSISISISSLTRQDSSQDAPLDWSIFFGAGLRIEKIVKKLVFFGNGLRRSFFSFHYRSHVWCIFFFVIMPWFLRLPVAYWGVYMECSFFWFWFEVAIYDIFSPSFPFWILMFMFMFMLMVMSTYVYVHALVLSSMSYVFSVSVHVIFVFIFILPSILIKRLIWCDLALRFSSIQSWCYQL